MPALTAGCAREASRAPHFAWPRPAITLELGANTPCCSAPLSPPPCAARTACCSAPLRHPSRARLQKARSIHRRLGEVCLFCHRHRTWRGRAQGFLGQLTHQQGSAQSHAVSCVNLVTDLQIAMANKCRIRFSPPSRTYQRVWRWHGGTCSKRKRALPPSPITPSKAPCAASLKPIDCRETSNV